MFFRITLVFAFVLCTANLVHSQVRIGIRLSPLINTGRITAQDEGAGTINSQGAGLRVAVGPEIDYFLYGENVAFTTGFQFAAYRAGFSYEPTAGGSEDYTYNLQYLGVPTLLHFVTNEISLDTKLYFEMGGISRFTIAENPQDPDPQLVSNFAAFDFLAQIGGGIERKLGTSTMVFAGISYQRGLLDQASESAVFAGDFEYKTGSLALDIGIRF